MSRTSDFKERIVRLMMQIQKQNKDLERLQKIIKTLKEEALKENV